MNVINFLHNGLTLRHLRLVLALEESRQIARVASAMNITQPAVSKALSDLEAGLGYALFTRLPRGVEPTAHGLSFARHARSIVDELDRALDEFLALGEGASETIAIGAMTGTTFALMPRIIALMTARMPTLSISVYEAPMEMLLAQLRTHRLDILLGGIATASDAQDVVRHHLCDEEVCIVVGFDHPLVAQGDVSWQDLSAYPWLLPPRASRMRHMLETALHRLDVKIPPHPVESVSVGLVLGMLTELQAVAFVTGRLARSHAARGLACILPLRLPGVLLRMSTLTLQGRAESRAITLFKRCAEQVVAG